MEFLQGMMNRMVVGYHKYGPNAINWPKLKGVETIELRLEEYEKTGNTEYLMDVANFCMLEFMHPQHPDAHFRGTDSDESPGLISQSGKVIHETKPDLSMYKHEGD